MKMVSYFFTIAMVVLTISQQATANKQDTLWHVRPVSVVIQHQVLGISSETNCTPLDTEAAVSTSSTTAEYVSCDHPTRITDSHKSTPVFTQDTHDTVYTWGSKADRVLFTFSSTKTIDSIALHYFSNSDNQGLPKIRLLAVPDDFEVMNTIERSYPLGIIDEVRPGREESGLKNKSRDVGFETSKILLIKDRSKNYHFSLSEIEFFTSDIDSIDVITTTATTAAPTTMETVATTTDLTESTTTDVAIETTLGVQSPEALSGDLRTVSHQTLLCVMAAALLAALAMLA